MKTGWMALLGVTLAIAACTSTTSDTGNQPTESNTPAGTSSPGPTDPARSSRPEYQEVIVPNGTTLSLSLITPIASDTSTVDAPVRAELVEAVVVDGRNVLPVGTQVEGHVTDVDRSGRVTGRATVAFRFTAMTVAGERYELQTAPVSHVAPATRGEDATRIGIGAGAGALIGGLLGGGDGAAKGAAVGGGAGAGVVLATRGEEIRLGTGAAVTTELTSPLAVVVP